MKKVKDARPYIIGGVIALAGAIIALIIRKKKKEVDLEDIEKIEEPWARVIILTPAAALSALVQTLYDHEAQTISTDKLEGIVPDDLWPLPKYAEILFIK